MDDLRKIGARYKRQRAAVDTTHRELVEKVLEARRSGVTLRAVAEATGLSFARIHQIENEAKGK